jgi:hypothetical protein
MWAEIALALVIFGGPFLPWRRIVRATTSQWNRLRPRRQRPTGRPLEQIARDARRLGNSYRGHTRGQSFAKYEAHRRAYDDVLVEACRALDIVTMIGVLEPGPALDAERARSEWAVECAGVELGLPL